MGTLAVSVSLVCVVLAGAFYFVYSRVRDKEEKWWAAPLTVAFSVLIGVVALLVPAGIVAVLTLAAGVLYPGTAEVSGVAGLIAVALLVAAGLFVYDLLADGFVKGALWHMALPGLLAVIPQALVAAALLLGLTSGMDAGVSVSGAAALGIGIAEAVVSRGLDRAFEHRSRS